MLNDDQIADLLYILRDINSNLFDLVRELKEMNK